MYFVDDFVVDDPLKICYFSKGDFLQISSGLKFILGYFGFTAFGVLGFSRIVFAEFVEFEFSGIVRIVFSCYGIGLNMLCLLILFLDSAQICRACFRFFILL